MKMSSSREPSPTTCRGDAQERATERLLAIGNMLEAAKSSLMFNGRWFNEAGYITDAALWIERAISTTNDGLADAPSGVTATEGEVGPGRNL
jgi:hypothetical protein